MSTVLLTVAPVFGLILIGYLAGSWGYVSKAATKGVPEFIFKIAMPVLLFRTIGQASLPDVAILALLGSFFGAAAGTWLIATVANRFVLRRPAGDGAAIAMGSVFSNSVMLGIPLCLSHFGPGAAPILAVIIAFDTAVFWLAATLHHASVEGAAQGSLKAALGQLLWRLISNPIILGCAAGLIWQALGLTLPEIADRIVSMLAQAAVPGALCALGLTLASYGVAGQVQTVLAISLLKTLVMPAIAWVLVTKLFVLPPLAAGVILVLAAMPVGANAYLFAAAYNRGTAAVSGAIALSTLLSIVTLSAILFVVGATAG
jgi:malonate transporter and related proteins